jgi:hypothetical protein
MRWVWLAPLGAGAYCVARLWPDMTELGQWSWIGVYLLAAAILAALVASPILLVATAIRRRRPGQALVAFALVAGLQAATPYHVAWEACNEHDGYVATAFLPYVLLAQPEHGFFLYSDAHTDMDCASPTAA